MLIIPKKRLTGQKHFVLFSIRSSLRVELSFDFFEAAWLQYVDKNRDYFGISSLEAQDVLLEQRSSHAASVVNEGQASSAASASNDDPDEDDGDRDLQVSVCLDDVELVDAMCHPRDV